MGLNRLVQFTLLAVLLSVATAAYGQNADIKFDRISLKEGLSQSTVWDMAQDHEGFMWFGTQNGLNKYNGYDFTVYKNQADTNSISYNFIRSLSVDAHGNLWIGTDNGLNKLNTSTNTIKNFFQADGILSNNIWCIQQYDESSILVGSNKGIDIIDPGTDSIKHSILKGTHVYSISKSSDNTLWIGTDNGLVAYDVKADKEITLGNLELSNIQIVDLIEDKDGNIWLGTANNGIILVRPDLKSTIHFRYQPTDESSLSNNQVSAVFQDSMGCIWIGTRNGLNLYNPIDQSFQRYYQTSNNRSLSYDYVKSIFEDRSGALWFGTDGGGLSIYFKNKNQFRHLTHEPNNENSLIDNMISSLIEAQDGKVWVGTWGKGVSVLDPEKSTYSHYTYQIDSQNGLSNNIIGSMYQSDSNTIWIGTSSGVNRRDISNDSFKLFKHNPDDPKSLSNDLVEIIVPQNDRSLWVGTANGLNLFDIASGQFQSFYHDPGDTLSLSGNSIRSIYVDSDSIVWVGTFDSGLNRFDLKSGINLRFSNDRSNKKSLSNNYVSSIRRDSYGILWVGTDDGLNEVIEDDGKVIRFERYNISDGLANEVIYGMLEDNQQNFWISTNNGLSKFNLRQRIFQNFDENDGLQSNEFNRGAYHKGKSGYFYFGGINGLTIFHPDSVMISERMPPVVFTSFRKHNVEVNLDSAINALGLIELNHDDHMFSVEFAALDYSAPEKIQYAYKLEDFDQDWIYSGTKRIATYTEIDPGNYLLRVKSTNSDGIWNSEESSIIIKIIPPIWSTPWFRVLIILSIVGLILGVHLYRLRQIRLHNQELENVVTQRTLELESLNKELESFSYSVSHDLRAPLRWIDGLSHMLEEDYRDKVDEKGKDYLKRIRSGVHQMDDLIKSLLTLSRIGRLSINKSHVDLSALVDQSFKELKEQQPETSVEFEIERNLNAFCDGHLMKVAIDNLVTNAMKFSSKRETPKIVFGKAINNRTPYFFIKDNGAGFDMKLAEKLFGPFQRLHSDKEFPGTGIGLATVHRIISKHGGRIWADAELNKGATFYFTL
ncbi:MAG: two-component regulator propeller domain-containing protein [Cyclobacteriaceae bacterium]